MSKLASKLSKRIMAAALSVAMVMSNMTVYATELTGPKVESTMDEAAVDTEDSSVTPDNAATSGDESPSGGTVDDTTGTTVEDPAGEVTDGDEQTPTTGGDEVTDPDDKEGNEDASSEDGEEVNGEIEAVGPDKTEDETGTAGTATLSGAVKFVDENNAPLTSDAETTALNGLGTITFEPVTAAASDDNGAGTGDGAEGTVTANVNTTDKTYTATLVKDTTYKMVVSNESDYKSIDVKDTNKNAVILTADKTDADITVAMKAAEPPATATGSTHILDIQNVPDYKNAEAGSLSKAEKKIDDYFTIYPGEFASLEVGSKTIGDYTTNRSISTGYYLKISAAGTISAGVKFTTTMPAKVTVYWNAPDEKRGVVIKDVASKETIASETLTDSGTAISVLELETDGEYVLGGNADIGLCRIEVVEGDGGPRAAWNTVAAPVIDSVTLVNEGASYEIKVTAPLGIDGGDKLAVKMYNEEHFQYGTPQPVKTVGNIANTDVDDDGKGYNTFTITPDISGSYKFEVSLSRKGEQDKTAEAPGNPYAFKFPLAQPEISTLMNIAKVEVEDENGNKTETGGITATWKSIKEADYYTLYVWDKDDESRKLLDSKNTEGTSMEVSGLTIGDTVYVSVIAYRENADGVPDASPVSEQKSIEITGEGPIAYIMDAADFESLGLLDAGLKLGTKDYFTLVFKNYKFGSTSVEGKAEVKEQSTGRYIEMNKFGSTGISFTVFGTANAVFSVASTSGSNESAFGLVNSEGELVTGSISGNDGDKNEASKIYGSDTVNKGNACIAKGTVISTIEYRDLPAGKYTFLSPYTSRDRGGRLHKISVYDSVEMPGRGEWSSVDAPKISNISYVKGESTIKVTASGYIDFNGADSVMVEMLNSKGVVVDSIVKSEESEGTGDNRVDKDLEFVFTPKASDNYSFRANLVRSGEKNIPMKDAVKDWTVDNFVLPLATPAVRSMTNKEDAAASNTESDSEKTGSLEVVFAAVAEADYYVVAALRNTELLATEYVDIEAYEDEEDAEKPVKLASEKTEDKSYTVILKGLPIGDCYVTVQAFRKTGSNNSKLKATTTTITRVAATGNETKDKIEKKVEDTINSIDSIIDELKADTNNKGKTDEELRDLALKALKGAAPTDDGYAIAVVRSNAYMPNASKYINGKNASRWFHTVFGSNTTRSKYTRKKALNELDNEYPTTDYSVPSNGYYEEVYKTTDTEPKPAGKDYGDLKSVTVWSENGRGKVVPASTDGLSYYYTSIDPSVNNFTLSALIHVKSWTFSNGQDGFGMMVSDTVGEDNDDGNTWTNCYQLLASKIQYSWVRATKDEDGNDVPGYVTNAPGNGTTIMRYEMKLGVGWNAKEGAKASDVAKINAGTITSPVNFSTSSGTLESSAGDYDNGVGRFSGSYNAVGNAFGKAPDTTFADDANLLTDFRFQIQKYDNSYALRYLAVKSTAEADKAEDKQYQEIDGSWYEILGEQVFSDDNNNKLTQIDKNNIYVGFFAARNARIGVSEINMNLTPAGDDDYTIPTISVDPSVTISSMEASNSKNYDLALNANFDGTLTIYKENNGNKTAVTTGKAITAGTKYTFTTALSEGTTKFTYYAKPNENFVPGENQKLSSFDMQTNEKEPMVVTYHAFKDDTIYVAPNGAKAGTSNDVGSSDNPTNVYDAVNYAHAGQTIILAGGMYNLKTDAYNKDKKEAANLLIGKKHDGTPKSYITMRAATSEDGDFYKEADGRPVLNFGQNTQKNDTAFTIAGNYWHFEGFDVINSKDGQKGILLGGSHNILSDLRTYLNGNTGIQVARYSNDGRSEWPSYNTLINCSSFMNYDSGYEDADGFAAKLTCGDGNKFIGCIAAFNADDGWDLFAKVESGSIGVVTIENCLAFKNGYLFGAAGMGPNGSDLIYRCDKDLSIDLSIYNKKTPIVSAGNGNGFKMGGDSMSGYHVLRNSIAFGNKSKGIDSNSCPDIQVYNSISYNNEANNVALYTGAAVNTDYYVENLVSIKDSSCGNGGSSTLENISPKGTQNINKIYGSKNYFWNGSKSANSDGVVFDTSKFGHMSMNNAIFGAKGSSEDQGTRIDRDADGSINLHGFLTIKDDDSIGVGGSNPDDMLDKGTDIYVFASEYSKGNSKLSDIKNLKSYDPSLDGYDWVDGEILISSYAGTAVDFKVKKTDSDTGKTHERTVTVNFIQLDGVELQVIDGDGNENREADGVLDADETWTVEAVPVISPAVEPDVPLSGGEFKAEIKETTKGLLGVKKGTEYGTVNANLKVAGANVTVEGAGKKNGSAKMTATLSLKVGNRTVKKTAVLAFTVKDKVGIKFTSISPDSTTDKVKWTADEDYIQVSTDTMKKDDTFTLQNVHFATTKEEKDDETGETKLVEKEEPFGKGVTIKVNDTSVIKLKSTANTSVPGGTGVDATFTVVNKSGDGGTATVTVTSKSDKSLVRNYIVTLSGSKFAWNSGTVTIDKAKTAGIQLAALEPFGTSGKVKNVTVREVYKGIRASGKAYSNYNDFFTADQVTTGVYELNTTAKAAGTGSGKLPRGTYTVVYEAEVTPNEGTAEPQDDEADSGNETPTAKPDKIQFTPITIKVIETRPVVTFKQTKRVNLFYKNGTDGSTGKLTVSSKQGAVTLEQVENGRNSNISDYFRFSSNGSGYDIVSINNEPVTLKNNGVADYRDTRKNSKAILTAHVEGYYDIPEYNVTRNFTVGVEYRKPRLKLTALDKTIYTAVGMDGADILIYDPDSEMYLSPDVATIELVTDKSNRKAYSKANEDFTVGYIANSANSGNGVRLIANSNSVKGGTVRLNIKYDDWFSKDSVIVSQNVRVAKTKPRATISPVRLNINTEKFVGKEQATAAIRVTGASGYTINDFKLTGSGKAQEFLKFVDYELSTDVKGNQVLLVSLKDKADDGTKFPSKIVNEKTGAYGMERGYSSGYSFKAEYTLGSLSQTTNFRISLVKNEKLTVAVNGSINIIDRENSTVKLKPRMTNFTPSQVASVALTGDAANLFTIADFDKSTGVMTVKAKDTAVLKRGSYKVTPVYYFDLGVAGTAKMQTDRPIVIRTTQSNLKITGLKDVLEVKLSSPDTAAQRIITVAPTGAYITGLTQTSGLENFTLTYTGDGVEVTINNRAGLKEGKTYRITALINVEGSGSNVKQQQIVIPVKVIR